jgi:hypothetical protein
VRTGQTPIEELKKSIAEIEQAGGRMRGIVLWNAPDPTLMEQRPTPPPARVPATV